MHQQLRRLPPSRQREWRKTFPENLEETQMREIRSWKSDFEPVELSQDEQDTN
jgi:hypothetical protein